MPQRKRRPRVNRHFKIDDQLRPEDSEAYLDFLREPRTTIDLAHAWLRERGFVQFSRSAVARHRRHFLEGWGQRQALAQAATDFARLAEVGEYDPDMMMAGLTIRHETLLARALFDLHFGEVSLDKLNEIGELVSRMVSTRAQLMELEQLRKSAAPPAEPEKEPTPEEQREALAKRVHQILGAPYPPPRPSAPSGSEPGTN